jgi:hypothetical protein
VCDGKTCSRITAGKDCEFKYMSHDDIKTTIISSAVDYCVHNLNTAIPLLTLPDFYPNRDKISDHSA